jgi:hypothetical protein
MDDYTLNQLQEEIEELRKFKADARSPYTVCGSP